MLGLGSFRFLLAFCVAISHLYADMIHGPAAYAVWGFFVLSGFLMTLILNENYGNSVSGLKAYAQNRFLRIFPQYLLACLIGLITFAVAAKLKTDVTQLNPEARIPTGTSDIFANLLLNPVWTPTSGRLVPVSGALATEVGAYLLFPLFFRSITAVLAVMAVSFFASFERGFHCDTFAIRYTAMSTCMLAFGFGALMYHLKDRLAMFQAPMYSTLCWILHCLIWLFFPYYPWEAGLYVSVILSGWVVISLFPLKVGALDRMLGDLTYPFYLLHTTVGVWILISWKDAFGLRSLPFALISMATTIAVSIVIIIYFDRPIMKLKKKPRADVPHN